MHRMHSHTLNIFIHKPIPIHFNNSSLSLNKLSSFKGKKEKKTNCNMPRIILSTIHNYMTFSLIKFSHLKSLSPEKKNDGGGIASVSIDTIHIK